jgi:hypothetical protein
MGTDGRKDMVKLILFFFRNFENEPKKQPLCGKGLGKTSTKHYKIRCRIELDTGTGTAERDVEPNLTLNQ